MLKIFMPQLDLFTFFPQIFWGFLFFFVQFFILSYYFLPLLASTLKFKKKYVSSLASVLHKEASLPSVENVNNNLLSICFKELSKTFSNIYTNCNLSVATSLSDLEKKNFHAIKKKVLKSSVDITFTEQYIAKTNAATFVSLARKIIGAFKL